MVCIAGVVVGWCLVRVAWKLGHGNGTGGVEQPESMPRKGDDLEQQLEVAGESVRSASWKL